jgi:16S rRNA (uracil1498-N3)-methyltransferase
MLSALCQLGVAAVRPLDCERGAGGSREPLGERAERIAREALKQCGRLWLPERLPPATPAELATADDEPAVVLDPRAATSLVTWCERAAPNRTVRLIVGPEGGLTDAEHASLAAAGAQRAAIGGHVLRIETAAIAASAIAATACRGPRNA